MLTLAHELAEDFAAGAGASDRKLVSSLPEGCHDCIDPLARAGKDSVHFPVPK